MPLKHYNTNSSLKFHYIREFKNAERVEELEESVWSVVRHETEREDQGERVDIYRRVVRLRLVHGAETRTLKKAQEKKLEDAEIRMIRWMCVVTMDKIRNERIRGQRKWGKS